MSNASSGISDLTAVPIDLLYDGMVVKEDIYDSGAMLPLIKSGIVLDDARIRSIRNLNANSDTIYVSKNTFRSLVEKRPPIEITSRRVLEDTTGYAAILDKSISILNETTRNRAAGDDALYSVSAELSKLLEDTSQSEVLTLINALAPADDYFQRHCVNVGLLNGLVGQWLHLPKTEIDKLVLIGFLHDFGKALMPPQVINAPRKLTIAEFEVIKMHPVYTYELLSGFPEHIRRAARLHHEKFCGAGYPDQLSGDRIPMEACITAVSDVYDAMVSQRAHNKPHSPFDALAALRDLKYSELDAGLVDAFIQNIPSELMGKPVMMSNGTIGVLRTFDPYDIEYPKIEVNGSMIKSCDYLSCSSMYTDD